MIDALDYEESNFIHKDDLPDLDFTKEMLISLTGCLYETGDIELLEDCLEEILTAFELKIPLHKPVLIKKPKENHMTIKPNHSSYTEEDIKVIKDIIDPKGKLNDSQIKQFLYVCAEKKLDPRSRQIYALPKENFQTKEVTMSIQTSIDGFRIIAERTGKYAPGKPTHFLTNDKGALVGATVYVKKFTADGTWHEVAATAFLNEYMPAKPSPVWKSMPSVMIEKCAEARALRRAFPEAFSGLYSDDEMDQSSKPVKEEIQQKEKPSIQYETITHKEAKELDFLIGDDEKYRSSIKRVLMASIDTDDFESMSRVMYNKVYPVALKNSQISNDSQLVGA